MNILVCKLLSLICPRCGGKGMVGGNVCVTCGGTGEVPNHGENNE